MQAPHRRKKKKRPMWSYMRNIRSLMLEAAVDSGVYGFTLSGQQPCILSSIVKHSPAGLAGVKSGDFLISVNGKSVWHKTHEEIVELIASSEYRIHITVADNCFSDSSEDEQDSSQNFRPKYPYSKSRSRDQFYHHQESSFDGMPPSRFHTHPPLPHLQSRSVMNIPASSNSSRNQDIANVSAMLKSATSSKTTPSSSAIIIQNGVETVSFSIIVGYLGTIEMPKQIATSSKLQTVRSCIRKLRQEKRCPTLVLMNILPNSLNLLNSNSVTLATYPSNRLNYISSSSDTNSKFFGLVTSATFQEDESRQPVAISNSCHVFGVETKLIDHNAHLQTAEKFHIKCTKDLISNSCLEFPMTSDYICNIIKSMYNIKSPEKVENNENHAIQFNHHHHHHHHHHRRSHRFNDPHEILMANSPHPSEITTSSNSDSGIGFHNDLNNISDRCFVVDIPDQNQNQNVLLHNKNLHLHRQARPLGIVNDYQLQDVHPVRNLKLSSSPQPSTSGIFHAKSKSADYDYASMEKLAIRAMPVRIAQQQQQPSAINNFENERHPKAVEDVWYDGEMLDEDGNEIHERPVDVPFVPSAFKLDSADANEFHKMMIQSCDDILMIMNKENDEKETKKGDDHVFLVPTAKPQKRCSKKSLTLLGKSKSSNDDSKSKHESNLKHYKLSPKVFGLPRPVSMSFENLSSSSSTKRRSLFGGGGGGNKKKESKTEEDEPFGIWGSLQELRNSDTIQKQPFTTFPEGTYSEPNLSVDESKQSQNDISPFKRWGQSSLRGARTPLDHRRPSSLTASESDVYTKIIEHDKHEKHNKHSSSHSGVTSWGQSFELLLNDPIGMKIFAEFLKKEFSGENIYFWTACERYRQINDEAERKKEAIAIYEKHLANGALEPVNVDFNARNYSRDGLTRAEKDLFSSAQKQIFNLMKFDSYQRFIRGELYKSCMHAEQTNSALPYCSEPLDPLLKIISENHQTSTMSSKLKKSLSNAEDRRRKSLLPWHRKTRCKSKDREEESKEAAKNSNTLKPTSSNNNGDVHSSRSSLSSFDATISKMSSIDSDMRNSLCRVILRENGATTIVQIKASETIRELVERVLEKRGFSYQAYEVFLSGTNKPLDLDETSSGLSGNEVFIEQRVVFKLDLPNRKVISVKSKPSKLVFEVLKPILHKYNYRLDMVEAYGKGNEPIDTALQVTSVDAMRLQIVCKDDETNNNNNNVEDTALSHRNFSAPVTFVRANKLVSSISNPQLNTLALDEITNKVFNEVLQGKGEVGSGVGVNGVVHGTNRNSGGDHVSVKSEDWGSETETSSGIFNRIRRHHKKSQKCKSSAGSEESGDTNAMKKPLIAKMKVGNQKLQVANPLANNNINRSQNDETLLESLKRAQFSRIDDQRGTDINFELPEFLKDRNKFGNKLRKTTFDESDSMSIYSNIESLSPNKSELGKFNTPQQKPPQPLPRTSLGKSPLKSSPEMASVQSKINSLEQLMSSSRSNTPINLNLSTQCLPSNTPANNKNNRNSDGYFCSPENYIGNYSETPMIFSSHREYQDNDLQRSPLRENSTLPPTLPPKPKLIPAKPSNWQMTNNKDVYLDQPTSSFV